MSKEPIVSLSSPPKQQVKRFLWWVLATVGLAIVAIVSTSIYSNHWGYFGTKGQFYLYNDRQAKVDHLLTLKKPLPEAYLIGSSDMLPFSPKTVEKTFGWTTYNLGNFWGRAEEIWAWSNFLINDLDTTPKAVFIGVEPWTFSADDAGPPLLNQYRRRFIVTKALAKYAPHYSEWRFELSRLLDLISIQNIKTLIKVSLRDKFDRKDQLPLVDYDYQPDGTFNPYNNRHPQPFLPQEVTDFYTKASNAPSRDATHAELIKKGHIRLQTVLSRLPYDKMDEGDLDLFEKTLDLLESHNITVFLILLPIHPYYKDLMAHHTRYLEHLQTLNTKLAYWQANYPSIQVVFDASDLSYFDGDPNAFKDENHMSPVNADRILKVLHKTWRKLP